MDIKEIKEKKLEVEDVIYNLLTSFSDETGLTIEGIDFDNIEMVGFTKPRYMSVKLDIRI